jgi:hypothetical protein
VAGPPPRATPGGFRQAGGERVTAVDLSDAQPARGPVVVVATIARGSAVRTQSLTLDRRGPAWLVTSLRG